MKKILFTHQGPHKVHGVFAETITENWYRYGDKHSEIIKNLIKSVFDRSRYDIILVEGGLGLPHSVLKKIKNHETKIILLNADTLLFDLPKMNPLKKMVVKFLLSYVDGFIAISPLNKKIALNNYPDKPISFVYPYGSNNSFQINCDLNSNNLLFIGNQESCKRFDLLVDAVEILNKRGNAFNLYLVGSCIDSITTDFPWLHKEGFQKNLDKYFKKCSLYVHPADFDSCPVTVFETMSSGMIPIITENVGEADILTDNRLEYLVLKDNNPKTIADKILEIHNLDEKEKANISIKCKEISSKYNAETQSKEFEKAFQEVVNQL
ncbi:glycosyltransferase [Methanobacterium spitsbergense]|uniref:Glycosyltransferase n=1 Tax=Methanobacterium spitsbergense TaxID=2874285 RepID=A0A8T5US18_9EURY|nr:glycosyltransferase [Methanobacterium spitsbergense]MBZ2166568.1 glycosyltransferase [Methanobacterium spitsbergense]